jgi:predicted 2-oxoglutarate/Fe(II)-dependent dioxygenase YbiX/peroxiredoxin
MASLLVPGEPVPWFHAEELSGNPRYAFDTAAGRWIVMLFLGSGGGEAGKAALDLLGRCRELFDDERASFFGVTIDPADVEQGRIARHLPGIRWFLDYDKKISSKYGAASEEAGGGVLYSPHWLLVDPMLRVATRAPLRDGAALIEELRRVFAAPPDFPPAPVLVVPGILNRETCRLLISLYERDGGTESGFMREENGITVRKIDPEHKRRADYHMEDKELIAGLRARLSRTLRPMIRRAFQFDATRIERWMVACYDARDGGHFRAHRDNTTKGTAHRRFAVTINLNTEDYEGGDLRFPEFGPRTYRAPTGGAVVFSCSLLHEARPVTKGKRYAFLPFLYDEEGARIREANAQYVAPDVLGRSSGAAAKG